MATNQDFKEVFAASAGDNAELMTVGAHAGPKTSSAMCGLAVVPSSSRSVNVAWRLHIHGPRITHTGDAGSEAAAMSIGVSTWCP